MFLFSFLSLRRPQSIIRPGLCRSIVHTYWRLTNVAGRLLLFCTYSLASRRPATEPVAARLGGKPGGLGVGVMDDGVSAQTTILFGEKLAENPEN